MPNEEHLNIILQGVKHWNDWRAKSNVSGIDLVDANLRHKDFRGINLQKGDLRKIALWVKSSIVNWFGNRVSP